MSGRDSRSRDDRRRRRDRDRDYDPRRDRDRERDERSTADSNPLPGPVILLKRPGSIQQSQNSGSQSSQSQGASLKEKVTANALAAGDSAVNETTKHAPIGILQRTTQQRRNPENSESHGSASYVENQQEKPKPVMIGLPNPLDLLKPSYKFPQEYAVTLIERSMKMKPVGEFDFFYNGKANLDFLVITAVGRPSKGKSTILSYLAGKEKFGSRILFQKRTRSQEMETVMYITSDNIIFIEIASVFNCAAAYDLISTMQTGTLETATLTWNLRLMRWAIAISHIVLIVSDSLIDPDLYQLINSAEMIHPMESALGEGTYPELIFVCNKAPMSYVDEENLQAQFQFMFSTVTGRSARLNPNFFILPHYKSTIHTKRYEEFKRKIYDFNRYNRAPFGPEIPNIPKIPQKYSAYDWFSNSTKLWEEMNQPNFFSSYVKLLP